MITDKSPFKICSKCNEELPLASFYENNKSADKHTTRCKKCIIKYQTAYRNNNKDKVKKTKHDYYVKNKHVISNKLQEYYKRNSRTLKKRQEEWRSNNPDKTKENNEYFRHKYYSEKPEEIRAYYRKYHKYRELVDINYKLAKRLRTRLWYALKGKNKSDHTLKLLGCSTQFAIEYLEKKFYQNKRTKEQMTWENYGKWHIDHIKPLSSFDLSIPEEQVKAFSINNLQPLWAEENLSKGAKIK